MMCAQSRCATRNSPHRRSWRRPAILFLLAGATLALAVPQAGAQTVTILRVLTDDVFVEGGTGDAARASFVICADSALKQAVTISYRVSGVSPGDIVGGLDRTAQIGANKADTTISLTAVDDTDTEDDETLTVTLTGASAPGISIGTPARATATLTDNDTMGIRIADASRLEGLAVVFVVTARPAPATDISGTYSTRDGSAKAGADYTAAAGLPFTIAAGMTTTTISIPTGDTVDPEGDGTGTGNETFTIELDLPPTPGVTLTRAMAIGTILENDSFVVLDAPRVRTVREGDEVSFTFRRTAGSISFYADIFYEVSVDNDHVDNLMKKKLIFEPDVELSPDSPAGTALDGARLPANQQSVTVRLVVKDDDIAEGQETVQISVTNISHQPRSAVGSDGESFEFNILPSDNTRLVLERVTGPASNPSVVAGGGTVAENGGTAIYRVRLEGDAPTKDVPVTWSVTGVPGGASSAEAADFGGALPASSTPLKLKKTGTAGAMTFTVTMASDDETEGDERFIVTAMTTAKNIVEKSRSATLTTTIDDADDVSVGVSTAQSFVPEGEAATFTFARAAGSPDVDTTVRYSVAGVQVGDFDDPGGGAIQIPAGQTRASVDLAILADNAVEDDETLQLTIDSVDAGSVPAGILTGAETASVVIPRLLVTATLSGPEQVEEGAVARFAVTLALHPAGATTGDVVLAYTLGAEGDSATRGVDYEAPPEGLGTLRIPAGELTGTIEVPVLRDAVREAEEIFRLAPAPERSTGGGASLRAAAGQQRVRILDGLQVTAALSGPEQVEEGAVARFAVTLALSSPDAATTGDVVLAYTVGVEGDSATRGVDYEAPPEGLGTLRIPAGELTGTIEVPALRDAVREAEEVFRLALAPDRSSAQEGASVAFATTLQTVRILDSTNQDEARREQRTRAMLAATDRAAAHLASEVITIRMGRGTTRAQVSAGANRESPSDVADANALPRASGSPAPTLATKTLGTALRLTGLSPGGAAAVGADGVALQSEAVLLAGIDAPVGAVATGPDRAGSDGAGRPAGGANADWGERGPRLPRLAELLRGVDFELRGDELGWDRLGEGLAVWGAGAFTSLEGDPEIGGQRLDYDGQSYGLFLGADQRLEFGAAETGRELLAGVALGWTRGDVDYLDRSSLGFEVEGRFESQLLAIHPYASLRLSPAARLWLLAGYGWGDVKIEERESLSGGDALRRVKTDATMWMVSVGAEGRVPLPRLSDASQLLVRVFGTRTSGSLDRARFDDGQLLRGTRARTWRVAGELEGGHRFAFAEAAHFRPFVTARLRGDAGDDLGDDWELSVDLGGGAELAWPDRGLSLGLRGTAQLNEGAGHREHRVVVDLSYDLAGDGRGLTVALESALEGSGRLGARSERGFGTTSVAPGAAFSPAPHSGGSSLGALLPETTGEDLDAVDARASALRHSIRGEIGYGLVATLPSRARGARGRGLLTPYARFDLAARSRATAAGLRFESPGGARLGVEAGVDFPRHRGGADTAATSSPVYRFLLTGELRF